MLTVAWYFRYGCALQHTRSPIAPDGLSDFAQMTWGPKFSGKPTPPEVLQASTEKIKTAFDKLSDLWFQESADFLVGTEISLADVTLAVMLSNVTKQGKYDLSLHPKLVHFLQEIRKRPEFKEL